MKKLTIFFICLLLVAGVLNTQAFAAENEEQETEWTIPVVEDKSFAELDGAMVPVNELEAKGYKLVLTPVKWEGRFYEEAPQELKDAYEAFKKTAVAERVEEVGNQKYWNQNGKRIYTLDRVLDRAFFDASLVKIGDNTAVESAKLELTIKVSNPFGISQVLNQHHDDIAWNAVTYTVDESNIVCADGATGLYAFLVPQGGHEMDDFVPSAEQKLDSEEKPDLYDHFVFDTAVWYAQEVPSTQGVKAAYAAMAETSVAELTYADGGEKLKAAAQEGGFDPSKLVVSDFLEASIVKDETRFVREQVIFEIPVAYASDVRLALHQLPDGTWKVAELMVKPGTEAEPMTSVTVSDGGTGVYVLLVDESVQNEILNGKYDLPDLFK